MRTIIVFLLLAACSGPEVILDDVSPDENGLPVYRYEVEGQIIYSHDPLKASELKQFEQLDYNRELLHKIKSKN